MLSGGNHGSSCQGKGKSTRIPIEQLCKMWSAGKIHALWELAVAAGQSTHRCSPPTTYSVEEAEENKIAAALTCARDDLYSKACSILTSSGLAPNCDETFVRLKSKHPFSDPPVIPHCPSSADLDPQSPLQLPPGYNMYKHLKSFKTATACRPSGMRVKHLLDAMKATLPLSLQTTLCYVC